MQVLSILPVRPTPISHSVSCMQVLQGVPTTGVGSVLSNAMSR